MATVKKWIEILSKLDPEAEVGHITEDGVAVVFSIFDSPPKTIKYGEMDIAAVSYSDSKRDTVVEVESETLEEIWDHL